MADSEISVEKRCQLLGLHQARFYRGLALSLRAGDLELMSRIDKLYLEHPWMGSRTLSTKLTTPGQAVGRDRVRRLMRIMGIESLAPKPGTSRLSQRKSLFYFSPDRTYRWSTTRSGGFLDN